MDEEIPLTFAPYLLDLIVLSDQVTVEGFCNLLATLLFWGQILLQENSYVLAWTTTPWTLPSNLALCVNPELKCPHLTVPYRTVLI